MTALAKEKAGCVGKLVGYTVHLSFSEEQTIHVGVAAFAKEKSCGVWKLVCYTAITSASKQEAVHVGM